MAHDMVSTKVSSLPNVLKHYLPEYEPRFTGHGNVKKRSKSEQRETTSGCSCKTASKDKPVKVKGRRRRRQNKTTLEPLSRETTKAVLRKQELKKFQKNYDDWEAVKAEHREETVRQLRCRISLQQDLIRKHDELYVQRQRDAEIASLKKRESEREARTKRSEALHQICLQSLEEDRLKAAEERAELKKKRPDELSLKLEVTDVTGRSRPEDDRHEADLSARSSQDTTRSGTARRPVRPTGLYQDTTRSGTPRRPVRPTGLHQETDGERMTPAAEEEGEEDEDGIPEEGLPWHAEQLYRMYGRNADYFLKPKLKEMEARRPTGQVTLKLRGQGARAGASLLWSSLRADSNLKLIQEDANISGELKAAYSSFVRQCLSRRRKPIKRNFYAEEDVPEMERLLDQSRIHGAHDYRHMVEVMFRASHVNEDRTGVLAHNNPLPNLNNWTGQDSCGRYIPPWIPTQQEEESPPEYWKWLNKAEQGQGDADLSKLLDATSISPPSAGDDQWRFLRTKKNKKSRKQPKYLFLTEEAASCQGEFSTRRREQLEALNVPVHSRREPSGTGRASNMTTPRGSMISVGAARSTSRPPSGLSQRFVTRWQPLSLAALVEYKHEVSTFGDGAFNHGSAPRWSMETAH